MIGLALKILGLGLTAAAGWIGAKYGMEAGAAVGTVGGCILERTKPLVKKGE